MLAISIFFADNAKMYSHINDDADKENFQIGIKNFVK